MVEAITFSSAVCGVVSKYFLWKKYLVAKIGSKRKEVKRKKKKTLQDSVIFKVQSFKIILARHLIKSVFGSLYISERSIGQLIVE